MFKRSHPLLLLCQMQISVIISISKLSFPIKHYARLRLQDNVRAINNLVICYVFPLDDRETR